MAENRPPGEKKPFQKLPGLKSVRRNLFGRDPDKPQEDLAKDVEEMTKTDEKRFMDRWNYDLKTDQPVKGKVGWGPGIPLNTQAPLLHVPSENETALINTASSGSGEGVSSNTQNGSHDTAVAGHSDPGSTSGNKSNGDGNCYQPPIKRQRSSDLDETDDDNETHS